jgi:hypothetical protein
LAVRPGRTAEEQELDATLLAEIEREETAKESEP